MFGRMRSGVSSECRRSTRSCSSKWADTDGVPSETYAEELQYWVQRDVPLYVLSRSGRARSLAVVATAIAAGFTDVAAIDGGFEGPLGADGRRGHVGWKAAGLPWRQW